MKRYGSVWLAMLLLVTGLIWLLNRLAPVFDLAGVVRDWWPLAMVVVGGAGVWNLREPLGPAKGPAIFALAGIAILLVIHHPLPAGWRPALAPLGLCVLGVAILVARAMNTVPGPPRTLERVLLIGHGRRLDWPVATPSILDVRAVAGGSIITIPDSSSARGAGRMEITALLSDVEVVVPAGWAVFVEPAGGARRAPGVAAAPDAATADLEIQSQRFLGQVVVRPAT